MAAASLAAAAAESAAGLKEEEEEEAMGREALLLPGDGRKPTSLTRTMPGTEKIESGGRGRERRAEVNERMSWELRER